MTINCKGQLIDLSKPRVMGILNVTPDSFYDGGQNKTEASILAKVKTMIEDGATFIDIGGYSSRPNAKDISVDEELSRVIPIIELIQNEFPTALISIDTFRSQVAEESLQSGACMVNDISAGLLDAQMMATVAKWSVPYIMMHMRGTPKTMQQLTHYDNLLKELRFYFSERIAKARELGISDLILDPGFGFAKTTTQNFQLLNNLGHLQWIGLPILIGISRKSMIYRSLGISAEKALNGTTALNMTALQKGAHILRVHDVKEAVECVKLSELLNNS